MARSRYSFADPDRPHFLTCTVVDWLPVFTRPEAVEIVLEAWRFRQERDALKIHGYVVLENHLHAVARCDRLPEVWASFKRHTAQRLVELLEARGEQHVLSRLRLPAKAQRPDRTHQFWQEGSHPQAIMGDEMMRQKIEYIHNNPVRRGYVDFPEDWRWSSARNYAGREGVVEVCTEW